MTPSETPPPLRGVSSRLPIAAMGIWVMQSLIGLIPLAFVLFVGSMPLRVVVLILVAFQVTHIVTWLRFTWRLDETSLIIERGLLMRRRRVIPRDRIQTVDLERTLFHRLLGVTEARVEAIGSGDTEGALPALEPAVAEALRAELLSARRPRIRATGESAPLAELPSPAEGEGRSPFPDGLIGTEGSPQELDLPPLGAEPALPERSPSGTPSVPVPDEDEPQLLARITPRELVVAGITGGRVGVGAAILGLISQVAPADWVARILLPGLEQIPDPTSFAGLRLLAFLIGMAILVGFATSLIATVVVHWNFTLTRTPSALQVRRGLLTEHRDTVPFRRIQALRIEENWIRRLMGLATVKVVVAGRAGSSQGGGADLILPVGTRRRAFELARVVAGMSEGGVPDLTPMPDQARRRRRLRAWIGAGAFGALIGFLGIWIEGWSPGVVGPVAALVMVLPALVLARLAYTGLGWTDLESHMVVREGILTRRWVLLPLTATQEFRTVSNPFQRRRRLATLELHIARPVGVLGAPRALDLDDETAALLRERLAQRLVSDKPDR